MPRIEAAPFASSDDLAAIGPTLRVHVGFDPEFNPEYGQAPRSQAKNVWALVDTGADMSCIDTQLAEKIGLDSIDTMTTISANGQYDEMPIFLAHIYVPNLEATIYGEIASAHLAHGKSLHRVLLGRDFLRRHIMTYNGPDGRVTLETFS